MLNPAQTPKPLSPPPATGSQGLTVMVIDDEEIIRDLITLTLVHSGYQVTAMGNAKIAVEAARKSPPDLLITDMFMPEQDGIETMMQLRREHPSLPIIAMSGGGQYMAGREILHTAKMMGANHLLNKPFDFDQLRAAVDAVMAAVHSRSGGEKSHPLPPAVSSS